MRLCTGILLELILLFLLAGCTTAGYQLPTNWPVKELTLPADAKLVRKVSVLQLEDKSWMAFIDSSSGYDKFIEHVESCLKPLSYNEFYMDNPRIGNTRKHMRQYYSPDGLTEVSISKGISSVGSAASFASDISLTITISATPDQALKYAGTTSSSGVKTVLEPIQ
jgi:hypothetical protein